MFQTSYAVVDTSPRRQNQNRRTNPKLAQLEDQADTILVGQTQVDDQNVKLAVNRQTFRRLAVCCRLHLVTSLLK